MRRRNVVGHERAMLEPEVVAAAAGGVRRAGGIEHGKLEALPSTPQHDDARRPRSDERGERRVRVNRRRRLKTESAGLEGCGSGQVRDIETDPIQSQRGRAGGHGRSAPRTFV